MRKIHDVIIVGAGPAGLHLSILLAKEGFDTLVVEKKRRVGEGVVCTGIVGKEAFDRVGLSKASIVRGVRSVRLVSPHGNDFIYDWGSDIAYVIDRQKFDLSLYEEAVSNGVRIYLGERVSNVKVGDHFAIIESESTDTGERKERFAKVIVLATGFETELQKSLNMGYPKSYLAGVNFQAERENDGILTILTGSRFSFGGFGWIVPENSLKSRVGLITEDNPRRHIKALLKILGSDECGSLGIRPIAQGPVWKTYTLRVISLGECAGQVKTTTGGGIYFGIISSFCAFETIKRAIKVGNFTEGTLKSYEDKWRREIGAEIILGRLIRRLWSGLSDKDIERIFNHVSKDGFLDRVLRNFTFDWHVKSLMKIIDKRDMAELFSLLFLKP